MARAHDAAVQAEYADFTRQCRDIGLDVDGLWHVRAWKERCAAARGARSPKYVKALAIRQGKGLPPHAPVEPTLERTAARDEAE